MHITTDKLPRHLSGKIWACLIAPRPIALVSTQDAAGVPNIAPYNSYAGLATHPAMLGISFSQRDGADKIPLANIKETGVFVVNLVSRALAEQMNTAAEGTEHLDDFVRLGLTRALAESINCPRISESPASLECRVSQILPLPPSECQFVTAEIVAVTLQDEYMSSDVGFDALAANLLASIAPEDYVSLGGEKLFLPKTW